MMATIDGTAAYARKAIAAGALSPAYRVLGRTGLTTSAIGFGCYRVHRNVPEHRAALALALTNGCNLIDTSTNYTDGESERCVGEVLAEMAGTSVMPDEVIVVSKVGYVQGRNLDLVQERARQGRPFSEVVEYQDGCWHCIHPEFIADQLTRSLERLAMPSLDVYLLHNPEYFLSDARKHRSREPLSKVREEFYDRVWRAFEHLENEVAAGRIRWYGVSSNTFPRPPGDPEATSLTRMLEIARSIAAARSGDPDGHHFAVVQLPMNLYETEAVLVRNNGFELSETVLEFAARNGIGVLVNRPLNAFRNGLVRLADFTPPAVAESVEVLTERVVLLEERFAHEIAPHLRGSAGSLAPRDLFRWGSILSAGHLPVEDAVHWSDVETYRIRPQVAQIARRLDEILTGRLAEVWREWWAAYRPALHAFLEAVRAKVFVKTQRRSDGISSRLDPLLPAALRNESLSRKAVAILANTPGVSCVLVGMRTPAYVEDTTGVLRLRSWDLDPAIFTQL